MRAIVTAGGTQEPIDDVRVVTNLSSGALGAHLAWALESRGADVILLASQVMLTPHSRRIEVQRFGTAADLDRQIDEALARGRVDAVFMAAAVSDWAPVRADGKLSSRGDELVLRMRPIPKILPTLRERCGARTVLVG